MWKAGWSVTMMSLVMIRMKRRADFLRVTRARNSAATPGVVVQARKHDISHDSSAVKPGDVSSGGASKITPNAGPVIRVGFTASRKIGNAVKRNRSKRRLRALGDEILPHYACANTDYVLIARAATADRSFEKLRGDLIKGLKRLKCWSDAPRKVVSDSHSLYEREESQP